MAIAESKHPMASTRGDTLNAPKGAIRIPVFALIALLVVVIVLIVVLQERWFLAILLPVALFSAYMVFQVASTMVADIQAGRSMVDDSEE